MIEAIKDIISSTIKPLTNMIDDLTTTKEEKLQLKNKLKEIENELTTTTIKEGMQTVREEIKSDSKLAKNWRPLLMLLFGLIIANNYIIYPYLSLFFDKAPILKIPPDMWNLIKIGLGGYVVGRSVEKSIKHFKGGKND